MDQSYDGPEYEGFVEAGKLFSDYLFAVGQAVKGNLREEMMLGLVLHPAHHQQPEEIIVFVVARCGDLMINKAHIWIFRIPNFLLVISDEDEGNVEA